MRPCGDHSLGCLKLEPILSAPPAVRRSSHRQMGGGGGGGEGGGAIPPSSTRNLSTDVVFGYEHLQRLAQWGEMSEYP